MIVTVLETQGVRRVFLGEWVPPIPSRQVVIVRVGIFQTELDPGYTVAEIRHRFAALWAISPRYRPYISGQLVAENMLLRAGDVLEFIPPP